MTTKTEKPSKDITNKAISKTVKIGGYTAVSITGGTNIAIQSVFIGAGTLLALGTTAPALIALGAGAAAFSAFRAGVTAFKSFKAFKDVRNLANGHFDKVADKKPAKFRALKTTFNLAVNASVAGTGAALLIMMPAASLPIMACAYGAAGLGGVSALTNAFSLTVAGTKKLVSRKPQAAANDDKKPSKKDVKKAVESALTDKSVQQAFATSLNEKADAVGKKKKAKKGFLRFKK